jgi:hypothetical protein
MWLVMGVFTFSQAQAQSYVLVPGDSIVGTIAMEDLTVFNFEQHNNSSDTLALSWQKLDAVVPTGWEATMCDNTICYTDLHDSSTQMVFPGEYGLASLHVTAHSTPGTAVVRYLLWDNAAPTVIDTLTWIIALNVTTIESPESEDFYISQTSNGLVVNYQNDAARRVLTLCNVSGKTVRSVVTTKASVAIDTQGLPSGLYIVQSRTADTIHNLKILIQP